MGSAFREIEMGPVGSRLPGGLVCLCIQQRRRPRRRSSPTDRQRSCPIGCATTASVTSAGSCRPTSVVGDHGRSPLRRWSTPSTSPKVSCRSVGSAGTTRAFGPADWDKIRTTGARGAWTARLWGAGYEVERFDHRQCVADQVTRRGDVRGVPPRRCGRGDRLAHRHLAPSSTCCAPSASRCATRRSA